MNNSIIALWATNCFFSRWSKELLPSGTASYAVQILNSTFIPVGHRNFFPSVSDRWFHILLVFFLTQEITGEPFLSRRLSLNHNRKHTFIIIFQSCHYFHLMNVFIILFFERRFFRYFRNKLTTKNRRK